MLTTTGKKLVAGLRGKLNVRGDAYNRGSLGGEGTKMNNVQKVLRLRAGFAVVVLLLVFSATIARAQVTNLAEGQSINLATVINSNLTLQIADKQFGNFFYSYSDTIGGAQGTLFASNITIVALSNMFGFGVQILEPYSLVGEGDRDFVLEYSALVTAPNYYIDDMDLAITGSGNNNGWGTVSETAYTGGFGGTQVAALQAFTPNFGSESDVTNIVPAQTELWVEKNVSLQGVQNNSVASISIINQTYSQIPEPSTVFLVGVGVLGVVALKRGRKS